MLWRRDVLVPPFSGSSSEGTSHRSRPLWKPQISRICCVLRSDDSLTCWHVLAFCMNTERKVEKVATGTIVSQRWRIGGQQAQILGLKRSKWLEVVCYEGIRRLGLTGPHWLGKWDAVSLVHECSAASSSCTYYYYYYYCLIIYLLTATELSLGGSSPYTSTDRTHKNKYTQKKQYKNTVQTIQNTVNTSTHITKTPTHYRTS
jgi:hypothetical protein